MINQTTRRNFMNTLGLGAAGMTVAANCAAQSKRPNVLFIAVDDLRPQVGCYGFEQMKSPNIDRIANEGVLFKRAYCNVPVCGASRASLMTGLRPGRDFYWDFLTNSDKDRPGNLSLPRYLRENGYYTISNGKIYHHLNDGAGSWSEDAWRPKYPSSRGYALEENRNIEKTYEEKVGPAYEKADVPDNGYKDGMVADKTIEDLQRLAKMDQPFFLAAGFMKPHLPFNAPAKYWDMYKPEDIDLADNPFEPTDAPKESIHNWGELRKYYGIPQKGNMPEDLARDLVHGYYACVSYTDAQIGRLLDELDRLNLRDNTIVILWGDHGWNLGEHTLWCKHCCYNTSLQTPMLLSAPGYKQGVQTQALTEFVDIYPTLAELCGLPIPEHCEGVSMKPLMENPDRPWKEAVYTRWKQGESIRTDRYLYTEFFDKNWQVVSRMLYDHVKDPQENVNIARHADNRALVEKLSAMLHDNYSAARVMN